MTQVTKKVTYKSPQFLLIWPEIQAIPTHELVLLTRFHIQISFRQKQIRDIAHTHSSPRNLKPVEKFEIAALFWRIKMKPIFSEQSTNWKPVWPIGMAISFLRLLPTIVWKILKYSYFISYDYEMSLRNWKIFVLFLVLIIILIGYLNSFLNFEFSQTLGLGNISIRPSAKLKK